MYNLFTIIQYLCGGKPRLWVTSDSISYVLLLDTEIVLCFMEQYTSGIRKAKSCKSYLGLDG